MSYNRFRLKDSVVFTKINCKVGEKKRGLISIYPHFFLKTAIKLVNKKVLFVLGGHADDQIFCLRPQFRYS